MNPTVLYSSRLKTLLRLLVFLMLAWFGSVIRSEIPPIMFWVIEIGAALCVVASAWLLFRPYRLLLDDDGLAVTGGFRWSPKIIKWHDVEAFTFHAGHRGVSRIGVTYKHGVKPGWWWGPEDDLPQGWQKSNSEIADYLNDWRLSAVNQMTKSA